MCGLFQLESTYCLTLLFQVIFKSQNTRRNQIIDVCQDINIFVRYIAKYMEIKKIRFAGEEPFR